MPNETLVFGTYTFPNRTFEVEEMRLDIESPVSAIRRSDGGEVLQGFLRPRMWKVNGKVYGDDKDTVHTDYIRLQRAVHNDGNGASFFYRTDRYVYAQMFQANVGKWERGLYEYMLNCEVILIAKKPYAESITQQSITGSRTNNSSVALLTTGGNYPAQALWTFVAGHTFTGGIRVDSNANSHFFTYGGPMTPGQTLIIDTALGCVLLQVGLTMVDAISYFGGNLFMPLEDGGVNSLVVNAPTLNFTALWNDRYYS